MSMQSLLAIEYLKNHPSEASTQLSALPHSEVLHILESSDTEDLVASITAMDPFIAGQFIHQLNVDKANEILSSLDLYSCLRVLRSIDADKRSTLVQKLDNKIQKKIKKLLFFSNDTVGAWTTPNYLQFHDNLTIKQALNIIQEHPKQTSNILFVVSPEGLFRGYVLTVDLLRNKKETLLSSLVVKNNPYLQSRTPLFDVDKNYAYFFDHIAVLDDKHCLVGGISRQELNNILHKTVYASKSDSVDFVNVLDFYLHILSKLAELFFSLFSNQKGMRK